MKRNNNYREFLEILGVTLFSRERERERERGDRAALDFASFPFWTRLVIRVTSTIPSFPVLDPISYQGN